jgi:hypothetical protein
MSLVRHVTKIVRDNIGLYVAPNRVLAKVSITAAAYIRRVR